MQRSIHKAALLVFRNEANSREVMFVQARNKPYMVLPGGKLELDEPSLQALERELDEELGVKIDQSELIGTIQGKTPDGRLIVEDLYVGQLVGDPTPQAEIESIVWLNRQAIFEQRAQMTPLTLEQLVPFLDTQKLW